MYSLIAPSLPQREPCCKPRYPASVRVCQLPISQAEICCQMPVSRVTICYQIPQGCPPLQVVVETNDSCIKLSGFSSFALFLQFPSRGLLRQKCCTSTQNSTEIKPENFVIIEPTVYMTAVTHRNQEIGLEIRKSDLKSRNCIINQQKSIYRSTEIRLEIKKVCYKSPEFEILYTFERCGGPLGFVCICAYC